MKKSRLVSIFLGMVILVFILLSLLLIWNNPKLVRYKALYPYGIKISGIGKTYFDGQYSEISIQKKGDWQSDGKFRMDPLDKDIPLRFRIDSDIFLMQELDSSVLIQHGFNRSNYEEDSRYIIYSIGKRTSVCYFIFDANDELVDFYIREGWLGSQELHPNKSPIIQLSWRNGDWFSLPLTTQSELELYMGKPKAVEKYRELD
jgi:hypothetical protein